MIIRKDKSCETNSLFPNSDWYGEGNFIIDETTEQGQQMAQTYTENYPFVDFESEGDKVAKVLIMDKPERPVEVVGKEIVLEQNEYGEWFYVYVDIPKSEIEIRQDIINTLGQELANIKIQLMMGGM